MIFFQAWITELCANCHTGAKLVGLIDINHLWMTIEPHRIMRMQVFHCLKRTGLLWTRLKDMLTSEHELVFRTLPQKLKIRSVRDIIQLAVRIKRVVLKDMVHSSIYCPVAKNGEGGTDYLTSPLCILPVKQKSVRGTGYANKSTFSFTIPRTSRKAPSVRAACTDGIWNSTKLSRNPDNGALNILCEVGRGKYVKEKTKETFLESFFSGIWKPPCFKEITFGIEIAEIDVLN